MGDTHITGRHIGGGTHITSDMCAGIHISRGYTYHCDTQSRAKRHVGSGNEIAIGFLAIIKVRMSKNDVNVDKQETSLLQFDTL